MPLTDEQKAAVKLLAGAEPNEVADALKDDAQPVFQHVFRKGYGTAQGEYEGETGKLTKAQSEAAAHKARADKAEADLQEVQSKQPDVQKIHADWQAKLDAARAEAEAERTARKAEREARKLSDLRAHLTGLDPEYARWKATEHAGRLRPKDDGTVELLEAGSEVPMQIPAGKTPYQVLAEEITRTAPAALRTSNADTGGGTGGGGGGGGNVFDRIREQTKNRQEGAAETIPLEKRLGMTA